jgi:hypothetical protein
VDASLVVVTAVGSGIAIDQAAMRYRQTRAVPWANLVAVVAMVVGVAIGLAGA